MTEDRNDEIWEYETNKLKLENSISSKGRELLVKLRLEALYLCQEMPDTAFTEAAKYVAALEQGVYPSELEKRQQLSCILWHVIKVADEMSQLLKIIGFENTRIFDDYEKYKSLADETINRFDTETTRSIGLRFDNGDMEIRRYQIESKDGGIVERYIDSTVIPAEQKKDGGESKETEK